MKETIIISTSKKHIVIITNREDITADYVVLEFSKRAIPFFRFNTEDFPARVKLSLNLHQNLYEGSILSHDCNLPLSDIKSIWYRRPVLPLLNNAEIETGVKEFCIKESFYALEGLWASLDCFWVSNPFNIRKTENKPFQLTVASTVGFQIPKTLISNNFPDIKCFFEETNRSLIIKPIRTGVFKADGKEKIIFTSDLNASAIGKLDSSFPAPSIFQEKLPKKYDVRVTVIGDKVFATEIHSQEYDDSIIDWRRGENPKIAHKKHKLPYDIETKCCELTKHFGLQFSAIDLVLTPDENYFFLEINPNGQWAWIEERTGYKLTEALVDLLCGIN